jgi:hypothetical protein
MQYGSKGSWYHYKELPVGIVHWSRTPRSHIYIFFLFRQCAMFKDNFSIVFTAETESLKNLRIDQFSAKVKD